jgi:hypothetical protein
MPPRISSVLLQSTTSLSKPTPLVDGYCQRFPVCFVLLRHGERASTLAHYILSQLSRTVRSGRSPASPTSASTNLCTTASPEKLQWPCSCSLKNDKIFLASGPTLVVSRYSRKTLSLHERLLRRSSCPLSATLSSRLPWISSSTLETKEFQIQSTQ